jgi:hypothetical protein
VDLTWNTGEAAAERTAAAEEHSGGGGTQRRPGESEPGGASRAEDRADQTWNTEEAAAEEHSGGRGRASRGERRGLRMVWI